MLEAGDDEGVRAEFDQSHAPANAARIGEGRGGVGGVDAQRRAPVEGGAVKQHADVVARRVPLVIAAHADRQHGAWGNRHGAGDIIARQGVGILCLEGAGTNRCAAAIRVASGEDEGVGSEFDQSHAAADIAGVG